jgi:hypothetical protein
MDPRHMTQVEKAYYRLFSRILGSMNRVYRQAGGYPGDTMFLENTGESMDNILKIHYIKKHHRYRPLSRPVRHSLRLVITEAMGDIERRTGVPVVSVTYDHRGFKNEAIIPIWDIPEASEVIGGVLPACRAPEKRKDLYRRSFRPDSPPLPSLRSVQRRLLPSRLLESLPSAKFSEKQHFTRGLLIGKAGEIAFAIVKKGGIAWGYSEFL